jgi:hypothetical protein
MLAVVGIVVPFFFVVKIPEPTESKSPGIYKTKKGPPE